MKLDTPKLTLLALAGALLAGPALAADVAPTGKPVKPVAQERNGDTGAAKPKPAAAAEPARKDGKADSAVKTRQVEVLSSVVLTAD